MNNTDVTKTTDGVVTVITLDFALNLLGYNVRGLTRDLVAARLLRGETLRTSASTFRVAA